jgi:hypothetical protein
MALNQPIPGLVARASTRPAASASCLDVAWLVPRRSPPRRVLLRLLIAAALALPLGACGGDDQAALGRRAEFRKFALYYVGDSFQGHRLRHDRSNDASERSGRSVSFLYGDCQAHGDAGCALPLEIETYAACARNRNSYSGPDSAPSRRLRIRKAPAAVYGEHDLLELYTGNVTVVIHADGDLSVMRAAADALRSVDGRVGPHDPLPPPAGRAAACRK